MVENKRPTAGGAQAMEFPIICPYCFNQAAGGRPFSHKDVHFRAETVYPNLHAIEQMMGKRKVDIEMMTNTKEQAAAMSQFEAAERFLQKDDPIYNRFWSDYNSTSEQESRMDNGIKPWTRPVIRYGDGVSRLVTDSDGFVVAAVDNFGKTTHRRVCPHCHNPLPLGFGKNPVKNISIIGITGAGKTVYISQLLKGMVDYAAKSGLAAFFTSDHESNFIAANQVAKGKPLPDSTLPNSLSQPMFYDIIQSNGSSKKTDTIVLYDIAGENCRSAADMVRFARFIEHSDGLILLIDPKQLNFTSDCDEENVDAPSLALNTLHGVITGQQGRKCTIPMAVCVSKSDQCFDILPSMAQEHIQVARRNEMGVIAKEFDGSAYNQLSQEMTRLIENNALSVCNILQDNYLNFNFFAVSAIGCDCTKNENGVFVPSMKPEPRRIEEPILWLFKQFGFIHSNTKVLRPYSIKQPDQYVWKSVFIGGKYILVEGELAKYEEDKIREHVVFVGGRRDGEVVPIGEGKTREAVIREGGKK